MNNYHIYYFLPLFFIIGNGNVAPAAEITKKTCKYGITYIKVENAIIKVSSNGKPMEIKLGNFWMSESEISYRQYAAVCGIKSKVLIRNNIDENRLDMPVGNINYFECRRFAELLSYRLIDYGFFKSGKSDLPTELQWEFVASNSYPNNIVSKQLLLEYSQTSGENLEIFKFGREMGIKKIGFSLPNKLGIRDILGNSLEICREPFHDNFNYSNPATNYSLDDISKFRISVRGGFGWEEKTYLPSNRSSREFLFGDSGLGFRLVWEE